MPFAFGEERLREKRGRRAIVVVGIVDIVRVELDLVVVEVEVRSVVPLAISIVILPLSTHITGGRGLLFF